MGINSQRGITTTSALFTLFLVGFFLTLTFKLGPHYLDNKIVQGAIDQVGQSDINGKSDSEIRRKIANFFTINNIRDYAKTGIDRISIGSLTKNIEAIDFSVKISQI